MAAAPLLRAVFDTNLLVRLLITPHGVTARLLTGLRDRAYGLMISEPLLAELLAVLRYPHLQKYGPFSERDLWRVEDALRDLATVVPGHYVEFEKVPTDAKDNMVVACALEGGADYIVTDDRRDLLPLKVVRCPGFKPVQIVRPSAFFEVLSRAGG